MPRSELKYVQFGAGYSCPDGWLNFDSSPTLRFERLPVIGRLYTKNATRFPAGVRYGDVVTGLPVDSASCRGVYASHVLEHLTLEGCRAALSETLRILAPNGIFRAVVPDLRTYGERYLAAVDRGDPGGSHRFMEDTSLGVRTRSRSLLGVAGRLLGNSAHLWMWDDASLSAELRSAGFRDIRSAEFGDCDDPMFRTVEDAERFIDACAIEARK